jgi:TP901-1 family phage major tail protein
MALLAGKDVQIMIKHATVTSGTWKIAVCATEHSLSRKKTETTVITKCGSETTPGTDDDSISLTVAFIKGPAGAGELNGDDLEDVYIAEEEFEWRITDAYPSASYIDKQGFGVMTSLDETYPAEGVVQYAFNIKVNGEITKNV